MFELSVTIRFTASHQLVAPGGATEPAHEHEWRVTATVAGSALDASGLLIDFGDLRRTLHEVVAPLAGRRLNDLPVLAGRSPSAENVAAHLAAELSRRVPANVRLACVEVEEEAGCVVRVRPAP